MRENKTCGEFGAYRTKPREKVRDNYLGFWEGVGRAGGGEEQDTEKGLCYKG